MLRSLFSRPDSIDVAETARRLDLGEIVLVDVREPSEWRSGRARGARHVPLVDDPAEARDPRLTRQARRVHLPLRRALCRACAAARDHGIEALNVHGGMGAWQRAGLPVTSG